MRPTHPPQQSARPGLTFQVESFVDIARDLPRLFEMHWQELESDGFGLELNPDWDLIYELAMLGRLRIMTARWGKILVGYIFNLVLPTMYSKTDVQAQINLYFLHPQYRDEPGFLMKWFRANDDFLISLGVRKIYGMIKSNYKDGKMAVVFKRLGYAPVEQHWARMVP